MFDCQQCGACCAWSEDWPAVGAGDPTDPSWVTDGHVRWAGDRCAALQGAVGGACGCRIYETRPTPCRACAPGSLGCVAARRRHGLPVPPEPSTLDALMQRGARVRLR